MLLLENLVFVVLFLHSICRQQHHSADCAIATSSTKEAVHLTLVKTQQFSLHVYKIFTI